MTIISSNSLTVSNVNDGQPGIPGSSGAPGTSAINIDLSNKSYNFLSNLVVSDSGTVMQAISGSTTTSFTAIQGITAINITALSCSTTLPTGMNVSIGAVNTTAVVVTISVDNTMTTANGTLNFSVTAGGVTQTKSFSYSLAISDLNVENLAALNATLGNVTAGTITNNWTDSSGNTGTTLLEEDQLTVQYQDPTKRYTVGGAFSAGQGLVLYEDDGTSEIYNISLGNGALIINATSTGQMITVSPNGITSSLDISWTSLTLASGFSGTMQYCIKQGVVYVSLKSVVATSLSAGTWKTMASFPTGSKAIPSVGRTVPLFVNGPNSYGFLADTDGGLKVICSAAVSNVSLNGMNPYPVG